MNDIIDYNHEREALMRLLDDVRDVRNADDVAFGWSAAVEYFGSAVQRTQAAGVPEGWKLVPVEPTPEMMKAGCAVPLNKAARHNSCYRAMLAAAPAQPAAHHTEQALEMVAPAQPEKVAHSAQWPTTPGLSARPSDDEPEVQRLREAVAEFFHAKQALADFERDNPGNSTKRWDACLLRVEVAEDAMLDALAASTGQEVKP